MMGSSMSRRRMSDWISSEATNNLIREHRLNFLPVIADDRRLRYRVLRKHYEAHNEDPDELIDHETRLMVGGRQQHPRLLRTPYSRCSPRCRRTPRCCVRSPAMQRGDRQHRQ